MQAAHEDLEVGANRGEEIHAVFRKIPCGSIDTSMSSIPCSVIAIYDNRNPFYVCQVRAAISKRLLAVLFDSSQSMDVLL